MNTGKPEALRRYAQEPFGASALVGGESGQGRCDPGGQCALGIPDRRFVTNEDKARHLGESLERVADPYVRMSLTLQQAFGLRREESLKFRPGYADRGDAARIERLRERLKRGDPDMTTDELEAAIDRAEAKRRKLQEQQAGVNSPARMLSIMPRPQNSIAGKSRSDSTAIRKRR